MNIQRDSRPASATSQLPVDPSLDLDRILWDLEYRRDMIARLAREAREDGVPE